MIETVSKLNPAQQLLFWSVVGTAVLSLGNLSLLAALVVIKRWNNRIAQEALDTNRQLLDVNRKWVEYATHKTERIGQAAEEVKAVTQAAEKVVAAVAAKVDDQSAFGGPK